MSNLVANIEAMLARVIGGEEVDLPEGALDTFAENVRSHGEKLFKPRDKKRKPKTLYMSEVGKPCRRQLWYKINKPELEEPLPPTTLVKFFHGNIIEEVVILLLKASGAEVANEQERLEIPLKDGWKIAGRQDGEVNGNVEDIKSSSPRGFIKFQNGKLAEDDAFGYLPQLSLYNIAKERPVGSKTGFIVMEKSLSTIVHDEYVFDGNSPIDFDYLVDMVTAEEPPERRWEAVEMGKSGNEKLALGCSYCPFKVSCWPELRGFAYKKGPVFLTKVAKTPDVPEINLDG